MFDGMGGELNAATSREHTVVYARVPDRHLETALDVMADMVFAPSFADLDSEREVVLEEIAMVEDTPQELVHDLLSEAIFGSHPLGRPVIGRAEVISTISRRAIAAYHRTCTSPGNIVLAAAGQPRARSARCDAARAGSGKREPPATGAARPAAAREAAARRRALPAQGHRAVPRVHRRARHLPLRPAPFRRLDPGRDPRRVGLVAAVPGDPREARHGVLRLHASARSTPTRAWSGSTSARARRTSRPASRSSAEQIADIAGGNLRPTELERAKENLKGRIMLSMESTSNRMSRLGKSLITDTELLSLDRIIAEIEAVEADGVAELAALLLAPERLSAARDRAERGALPRARARAACTRRSAGARRGVKVALIGRGGKVGSVLAPRSRRRARAASIAGAAAEAMVDFTRPDAVVGERRAALDAGVPCVIGTTGCETSTELDGAGSRARASPSSSRRTSRSARC